MTLRRRGGRDYGAVWDKGLAHGSAFSIAGEEVFEVVFELGYGGGDFRAQALPERKIPGLDAEHDDPAAFRAIKSASMCRGRVGAEAGSVICSTSMT